jgi:hypothetical protein
MEHIKDTPIRSQKFTRWALMLGIIIILNIFFMVLTAVVFPAPQYQNYCTPAIVDAPAPTNAQACDSQGGTWTESGSPSQAVTGSLPNGYCDVTTACEAAYTTANSQYALHAFVLVVALGILALIAGFIPMGSSMVSSGLSYGGVLALIIGSAAYWGTAGNWIRLAITAVGLGILLYIGMRRFRD